MKIRLPKTRPYGQKWRLGAIAEEVSAVESVAVGNVPVMANDDNDKVYEELELSEKAQLAEAEKKATLVHNSMSAMLTQASEVALEEAASTEAASLLGDMEITLNAIKPAATEPLPLSFRSPTSQFELNIMDAAQQKDDLNGLHIHKNHSLAVSLFDDNESIVSEDSLGTSQQEQASSTHDHTEARNFECTDFDIIPCVTDFMYCQMRCGFPHAVEEVDEWLSCDLHHLVFHEDVDGNELLEDDGAGAEDDRDWGDDDDEENRQGGVAAVEDEENQEEGVEIAVAPVPDEVEQGEGALTEDKEGEGEEGGKEVVALVDEQKYSEDVELSRHWEDEAEVMQARFDSASYIPATGYLLRKEGMPVLAEDEVLIRVDATSLSTRDCLEKLRRDTSTELMGEIWVPGHEIVGQVVRSGSEPKAEFLLGKRVAALLPYGGGCSQYVCIRAKNAIVVPDEDKAGSHEVVALLSTYMTACQCLESAVDIELGDEDTVGSSVRGDADDVSILDIVQNKSPLFHKQVLIMHTGSPIGLALVELAKLAGAIVHVASRYDYLSAIREVGADYWYPLAKKEEWEDTLRGKMDLIIDMWDHAEYHPFIYKVMKIRGRVVKVKTTSCEKKYVPPATKTLGLSAQDEEGNGQGPTTLSYEDRVIKDKTIIYDIFHSFNDDKEMFEEDLTYLLDLLQVGKIKMRTFSRVGLDELDGEWTKLIKGGTSVAVVSPWKVRLTRMIG